MTWSKRSGYGALPKPCFEALRLPQARHSISQRFPVAVRAAIRESVLFVTTEQLAKDLFPSPSSSPEQLEVNKRPAFSFDTDPRPLVCLTFFDPPWSTRI